MVAAMGMAELVVGKQDLDFVQGQLESESELSELEQVQVQLVEEQAD